MRNTIYWLITDTHFNHPDMIKLYGRPEGYDEKILKNLRHFVAKQDVLIHLGDVIFYQHFMLKSMLDSVPGRKFLTLGNHDRKSRGWYMRNGFDGVFELLQLGDVLLSHKPVQNLPMGVRLNVHGHWHGDDHRSGESIEWYDAERYRLLAVENTGYAPVQLLKFTGGL